MFSDRIVAEKIHGRIMSVFELVDGSVSLLDPEKITDEELAVYYKFIGSIMGIITMDFLNEIYRKHPVLKPVEYLLPEDYMELKKNVQSDSA